MYAILLILSLSLAAIFLVVLLIGDKREARLEAQKKALQEQIIQASKPMEGVWPPPPRAAAMQNLSQPVPSPKLALTPSMSTKIVRAFFRFRGYAFGTALVAFIIYSCYPQLSFGWVLLATLAAFFALARVVTIKRSPRPPNRQ